MVIIKAKDIYMYICAYVFQKLRASRHPSFSSLSNMPFSLFWLNQTSNKQQHNCLYYLYLSHSWEKLVSVCNHRLAGSDRLTNCLVDQLGVEDTYRCLLLTWFDRDHFAPLISWSRYRISNNGDGENPWSREFYLLFDRLDSSISKGAVHRGGYKNWVRILPKTKCKIPSKMIRGMWRLRCTHTSSSYWENIFLSFLFFFLSSFCSSDKSEKRVCFLDSAS